MGISDKGWCWGGKQEKTELVGWFHVIFRLIQNERDAQNSQ